MTPPLTESVFEYNNLTWRLELKRALDRIGGERRITTANIEIANLHMIQGLVAFHLEYYDELECGSRLVETVELITREFRLKVGEEGYTGRGKYRSSP